MLGRKSPSCGLLHSCTGPHNCVETMGPSKLPCRYTARLQHVSGKKSCQADSHGTGVKPDWLAASKCSPERVCLVTKGGGFGSAALLRALGRLLTDPGQPYQYCLPSFPSTLPCPGRVLARLGRPEREDAVHLCASMAKSRSLLLQAVF